MGLLPLRFHVRYSKPQFPDLLILRILDDLNCGRGL